MIQVVLVAANEREIIEKLSRLITCFIVEGQFPSKMALGFRARKTPVNRKKETTKEVCAQTRAKLLTLVWKRRTETPTTVPMKAKEAEADKVLKSSGLEVKRFPSTRL
uniref:Uncharacterized protein n=1 Tax=Nelumbo nucifera TaxID=4432 RepID=A0A822XXB3_NELNU|nr:TPA_asm: hypothetical protein HUJ06_026431 [Nelumbo nucifera]